MKIEREIREKISEQEGVSFYQSKTIVIELTDSELEAAYREMSERYLRQDIQEDIEEFCENHDIPGGIANGLCENRRLVGMIAAKYEKRYSAELAYRDMIMGAISDTLKEAGIWK